jgi:uncharacterized protein (TIGR04255 family)
VEVVFEIRFPGETAIEGRRYELQNRIRNEFPKLLVPQAAGGSPPALEPYRFESHDSGAGVMASLDRFAYYSRTYQGFESFRNESLGLIEIFFDLFPISKLTRIGLRHVNIIPFVREDGLVPLDEFIVLGRNLLGMFPEGFRNFSTAFVTPIEKGTITTRIDQILKEDSMQEAILLDFDYAKTENLAPDQVEHCLDEAHECSKELFRKLITKEYHDFIEGKET